MRLKTIRWILYIAIILFTIISATVSVYGNSYLLVYVTAIGPIIGVIISILIALEIDRFRLQDKYVKRHLHSIKNQWLIPLRDVISNRFGYFVFSDQIIDMDSLKQVYGARFHWYDKQNIDANMGISVADSKFYRDLDSHKVTKGIPKKFEEIKLAISDNYPKFLSNIFELYNVIEGDSTFDKMIDNRMDDIEFQEAEERLSNPDLEISKEAYERQAKAIGLSVRDFKEMEAIGKRKQESKSFLYYIFLLSIGDTKNIRKFPNLHEKIARSGYLRSVNTIANKYKTSPYVNNITKARENVQTLVRQEVERINHILEDVVTLDDKCPIIKENLKNY